MPAPVFLTRSAKRRRHFFVVVFSLFLYNGKYTKENWGVAMSSKDETMLFNFDDNLKKNIQETLALVYDALEEKGYNPINQIVGYLLSGDPAYIPRHNDARNLIRRHERDEIMEELVKSYLSGTGRIIQ